VPSQSRRPFRITLAALAVVIAAAMVGDAGDSALSRQAPSPGATEAPADGGHAFVAWFAPAPSARAAPARRPPLPAGGIALVLGLVIAAAFWPRRTALITSRPLAAGRRAADRAPPSLAF
jgi:hypothetical protein